MQGLYGYELGIGGTGGDFRTEFPIDSQVKFPHNPSLKERFLTIIYHLHYHSLHYIMKKSTPSASRIDEWIQNIKGHSPETAKNAKVEKGIKELFSLLKPIKPKKDCSDTIWRLWLRVKRGKLEDYGDYKEFEEEGIVQSRKDFEELWKMDCPGRCDPEILSWALSQGRSNH